MYKTKVATKKRKRETIFTHTTLLKAGTKEMADSITNVLIPTQTGATRLFLGLLGKQEWWRGGEGLLLRCVCVAESVIFFSVPQHMRMRT